ncbi:hypothetical protein [Rhizobium halophytocola]|uniref:DUF1365 family protein n=1 Tax=Rhizobium halophytocola TaxID=735519 RepID=A0ABS4E6G1_9HYPH|nr:hypothetical protein [Rhizobium halophytocola]MBP1853529.1 DUF1365 family protein [Rhizobium halophytocola]
MNGMEIFYYIVLPVTVVGIGWTAVKLHERQLRLEHAQARAHKRRK